MKKLIFLTLMFSSFMAIACGENEIESIGGPTTDGKGSVQTNSGLSASSSGLVGTECIELPPIQAVITYITFHSWLGGGAIGLGYALNAPPGGGTNLGIIAGVSMTTVSGCTTSTLAERNTDANAIYNQTTARMNELFGEYDEDTPQFDAASTWLQQYSTGTLFTVTYPDQSRGFFRVGMSGLTEEVCG